MGGQVRSGRVPHGPKVKAANLPRHHARRKSNAARMRWNPEFADRIAAERCKLARSLLESRLRRPKTLGNMDR
jgi:hypothetical protein